MLSYLLGFPQTEAPDLPGEAFVERPRVLLAIGAVQHLDLDLAAILRDLLVEVPEPKDDSDLVRVEPHIPSLTAGPVLALRLVQGAEARRI